MARHNRHRSLPPTVTVEHVSRLVGPAMRTAPTSRPQLVYSRSATSTAVTPAAFAVRLLVTGSDPYAVRDALERNGIADDAARRFIALAPVTVAVVRVQRVADALRAALAGAGAIAVVEPRS